ncbi:hypothetical protein ACFOWZ_39290 [Lentzea rhizosphaerae]|uniref:Translation initiation factor IF-2 n=1 Tax=Lentzea rhizosphaerae TaxID=2041025 RepID=A0ABV8C640_9PSEU
MSEQGQAPPPQEPPKNEPQAAPAPDQATTPLPAGAPATPGQQPTAEQPAAPAAGQPAAETPAPAAATAAEAPAAPHPAAATPSVAAPARPGRVRRFAGHRATQLVAVGLLGLVLGGGIVGAVAANRLDHRGGPGHVRMYDRGDRGPDRGQDRGQDRGGFEQRGPFGDRGDRFER